VCVCERERESAMMERGREPGGSWGGGEVGRERGHILEWLRNEGRPFK